ncbi:MAG TPA: hybrid sensor histidine kinase/response regulator [Candidatus Eisenbacteria bacterium]|nr:hybrid sensor histidine kinase/response regulator [Candidatus Eisenbacteria bacterium]
MAIAPRILGVDDNPRNLDILNRSLRPEFEVTTAKSGDEALVIAPGLRPDIVLLDIMMPGLDGYETCRRLRAMPEMAGTKIIMVSARAMTAERLEGYAAGANDYVVKPFDPDELLAKIRVYARLKSVEEVDGLKSNLLDLLGHETGTPLTGIMGALNLLRDEQPLTADQTELIDVAESSVGRLQRMVQRVCLITQLKSGLMPDRREPLDLRELVAHEVEEAGEAAAKAKVTLALAPGGPAPATADPELVSWAVAALLDNAVHASPKGGAVDLTLAAENGRVALTVCDHGPGVAAEVMPRLFEEFVVADMAHHSKGTGLSLAVSRLIAAQHGGSLAAENPAGGGAVFRLELPATAARAAA